MRAWCRQRSAWGRLWTSPSVWSCWWKPPVSRSSRMSLRRVRSTWQRSVLMHLAWGPHQRVLVRARKEGRKERRVTCPWQSARLIRWNSIWVGRCQISALTCEAVHSQDGWTWAALWAHSFPGRFSQTVIIHQPFYSEWVKDPSSVVSLTSRFPPFGPC